MTKKVLVVYQDGSVKRFVRGNILSDTIRGIRLKLDENHILYIKRNRIERILELRK